MKSLLRQGTRLWVIAPHADDEALGCGGLLNLARECGVETYVLFLTCSGYRPINAGRDSEHFERKSELQASMKAIGAAGYDVLYENGHHHLMLDTVPIKELIEWLEWGSKYSMDEVKPHFILIPAANHTHQDHRQVSEAMYSVLRCNAGRNTQSRMVMEYEIPGTGLPGQAAFTPKVYMRLSKAQVQSKCDLFGLYSSQVSDCPHLRSAYAIRSLASMRGVEAGYEFAEAYRLLRFLVE